MAKYAILFSYTPEAWAGFIKNPSDRAAAAAGLAEALGGKLESFYWMLGDHDGLAILDVPDSVSVAALSVAVNSTGIIKAGSTHVLFDADDRAALLEKAKTAIAGFSPPV